MTSAYNRAIKLQGDAAEKSARQAMRAFFAENPGASVEDAREFAIEILQAAGDLYGNACSQAAFDLQDEIAREFGTKPPDTRGWYYEPDAESIERTARYQAGKLVDGDEDAFVDEIASAARYYAERGANATMVETAKAQDRASKRSKRKGARTHGVRFARVPQGASTCRFCLMLASRGFVYLSEESAGEFDRFHKNCDCRIAPGYPGMELEGYDPEYYYDVYQHPENHPEVDEAINARRRELRALKGQAAISTEELRYRPPSTSKELPPKYWVEMGDAQFGKKIGQHAGDWGLDPSKEADRRAMREIIDGIIGAPDEMVKGEWRSQPNPCIFIIKGTDVVVVNANNEFVTILKDGATRNERVKHARDMGRER